MGSRHIGLQVRDLGGSRNRENVLALSVQPCEREGGGRDAQPTSLLLERRQQLHVLLQVLALQIRGQGLELGARPLGVADLVPVLLLLHQPARQTAAQRRVRHDRDAEVATQRHEICFEVAHDQRPLLLDGSQRVDAVCHPDFLGGRLRQPEVLNLPFLHQLLAGGHPALERVHARHSVQVAPADDPSSLGLCFAPPPPCTLAFPRCPEGNTSSQTSPCCDRLPSRTSQARPRYACLRRLHFSRCMLPQSQSV
mmetsp:Transcript_38085/g.77035  ORF Transcript_38085/g.77035 Transcript_38085/m.77035 type:complete len:253 (-) Transcript_38085:147-905(-)